MACRGVSRGLCGVALILIQMNTPPCIDLILNFSHGPIIKIRPIDHRFRLIFYQVSFFRTQGKRCIRKRSRNLLCNLSEIQFRQNRIHSFCFLCCLILYLGRYTVDRASSDRRTEVLLLQRHQQQHEHQGARFSAKRLREWN